MVTSSHQRQVDALAGVVEASSAFAALSQLLGINTEGEFIKFEPDYRMDVHPTVVVETQSIGTIFVCFIRLRRTDNGQRAIAIDFSVTRSFSAEAHQFIRIEGFDIFAPRTMVDEELQALTSLPQSQRPSYIKAWLQSHNHGLWYK